MTLTEHVKILDDEIKANKAQYDLDREAGKVSALSCAELEEYEYLIGEDLGDKPGVVEKAKFEYSPLGKVFNKGLDKSDKKEVLLKRFKNVEGKNEQQLETIKDQGEIQLEPIRNSAITNETQKIEFNNKKNQNSKEIVDEVNKISKKNNKIK